MVVPAPAAEFYCLREQAGGILVVLVNQQDLPEQVTGAVVVPGLEGGSGYLVEGFKFGLVGHLSLLSSYFPSNMKIPYGVAA